MEENLLGLLGFDQDQVNNEINAISKVATGANASSDTKVVAKKFAERKLKQVFVDKNLTKGQRFLMANLDKLTEETRKRIAAKVLRFKDANYYVRTLIAGGGEIPLITDALTKLPGVSNISKGQLPDQVNLSVTRVEVDYDNTTTGTVTAKTAEYRPIGTSNTDPALENGEIAITVGGTEVFRAPMNQFNRQEDRQGPANGFNLNAPILIPEKETIGIRLIMSDGTTLDTTGSKIHFISVTLKGDEIGQK